MRFLAKIQHGLAIIYYMTKKIILLVEDNRDDEELTLMAFEQSGIDTEMVVVRDGAEALDYLLGAQSYLYQNFREMPAVILLDLKLPKISGLEVLERLRAEAKTRFIPVVVLTTSIEDEDLVNSYRLGCNSYIRKPVDFTQFMDVARQLSIYWLHWNETRSI
jgi:two-component system, response regulator